MSGCHLIVKTFLFLALKTSNSEQKFQSPFQKVHNPNFYSIDFRILGFSGFDSSLHSFISIRRPNE